MINAWSLLYDEIYGDDEMSDEIKLTGADEGVVNVPNDINLDQDINIKTDIEHSDVWYDYTRNDPDRENPFTNPKDKARADRVVGKTDDDTITITGGDFINFDYSGIAGVGNTAYVDTLDLDFSGCYGSSTDVLTFDDTPTPGIEDNSTRKYKEDESIQALKDYISTTYGGHYTSDNNNVQTLDLIESVGDAVSYTHLTLPTKRIV